MDTEELAPQAQLRNISKYLENSGGHRKADVITDEAFPTVNCNLPIGKPEDLAYIVSYEEKSEIMNHTPTTGRAGFYPLSFEADGEIYNTLFLKGTGMPEVYIQSAGIRTAFSVHHREANKDLDRLIGYKRDVLGLCTKNDQLLDAKNSLQLHNMGIKVRLPIKGFHLEKLETEKGLEDVADLQEKGLLNESERPYMSLWALETPYRVDDLYRVAVDGTDYDIRNFLINANRYTANIVGYMQFRDKFKKLTDESASTADLLETWTNFILDNCQKSFESMRLDGVVHHNLHAQNVSLHGEICDNSEITVSNDKTEANRGNLNDVNTFMDGFKDIWSKYCKKTGTDLAYSERFDKRLIELSQKELS